MNGFSPAIPHRQAHFPQRYDRRRFLLKAGGGIGGLFFLGFLTNRVSAKAAAAGLVMGILAIIWCTLSRFGIVQEPFAFNVHPFMIIVVGNVVVFAAGLIASAFFPAPKQDEIVGMTWWTREQTGASV